jgi:diguanylate cyclase (GGDEF)-like protein
VSKKDSSKKGASTTPDWPTTLGLSRRNDADWGRVRAAQINMIQRLTPLRAALNLFGVGLFVYALMGKAPMVYLWGWAATLIALVGWTTYTKMRNGGWIYQTATMNELHRESVVAALTGLCWGAAPLLFGKYCAMPDLLLVWAICISLMSAAAFALSAVPLATSIYLAIVGSMLTLAMWWLKLPLVAGVAGVFTLGLTTACLFAGRNFVIHESAGLALAEKNEVVSLLLREFDDSGGDWMWQTDASKCLTHVSSRFAYALGVEPNELETKAFLEILAGETWESGDFSPGFRDLAERLKRRENFSDLILPLTIKGDVHWWELSGTPRYDDRGAFQGFRGVGSDVTAQRRSTDKINHMARFDTLTGLPNRLQVTEALGEAMIESEKWRGKCAFMMIDLDRFKAVNDTLGHPVGDRLLQRVAERLKSLMKGKNICGRLGGDEFAVVVFDGSDPNTLAKLARDIIDTISRPYEVDHHTLYIGASVGTAVGPRDGRSVEMLIRSADLALYRSKDQGGGSVNSYEPQLHQHAEERRVIEIALRKALENNEFTVHYQPVVAAENGQIESFEALLRWNNPELGNVSPAKFVPVAEDARLIGPIGEWVLRTACAEAKMWPETVRVAVNVSAEQLTDGNFVTAVVQALAQSGLSPHRLELEVTESVFMREGTGAVAVLEQILGLGVRLALDDFGTGYSSLGYLSKTKFSTIKIDRQFVQSAAKNVPESVAIIRAVVAMAQSLGMATTAEGVETEAELNIIRGLGCRKIQGWLFGRPMPAAEARLLFENRRVA